MDSDPFDVMALSRTEASRSRRELMAEPLRSFYSQGVAKRPMTGETEGSS